MARVPTSMRFAVLPGMRLLGTWIPVAPLLVERLLTQAGLERATATGPDVARAFAGSVARLPSRTPRPSGTRAVARSSRVLRDRDRPIPEQPTAHPDRRRCSIPST